jgi:hypothetical protein
MPKSDSYDSFFFEYVFNEERLNVRCSSFFHNTQGGDYQQVAQPINQDLDGIRGLLSRRCERFTVTPVAFCFPVSIFIDGAC